jgi:hypothetical protein
VTGPIPIESRLGSGEADENLGGKEESKKPISRDGPRRKDSAGRAELLAHRAHREL